MASDIIRSEEREKEIVDYLTTEHSKALSEREILERKWGKWRRQAEARPEQETKDYPWPNAANVSVPLTATITNGIYAATKMAFGERRPLCTVKSKGGDAKLAPHAEALTRFLDILIESPQHIGFRKTENTLYRDLPLLGTQFVEVPWEVKRWMFKRREPDGSVVQVNQIQKDGPSVIPIRIEDFIARGYFHDPQTMPCYSIRHRFSHYEMKREEALGHFENIDQVEPIEYALDENLERDLHRRGIDLQTTKLYEVGKFHVYWDVDEDGFAEDLIVWLDVKGGTILHVEFNDLGLRPLIRYPYIDLTNQLYAIGVGWMCEHLQDEVDALHNMRLDSTHLSSLQMMAYRRGCGLKPDEALFPAKFLGVDDPTKDLMPFKFPDVSGSTLQAEMVAREYADRYTGATNALMGFPDEYAKSRSTASGYMFQARQSDKLGEAVRDNIADAHAEVFQMVVFQLVRNRDRVEPLLGALSDEDRVLVRAVLNMNVEDVPRLFQFTVETTSLNETEEAKRQGMLMLAQLYAQYGQQIFQLLPIVYNQQTPPPIKEVATRFFVGGTEIMEGILRHFGQEDVMKYLPYTKDFEMMQRMTDALKDRQIGGMINAVYGGAAQGGYAPSPAPSPVGPGPGPGGMEGAEGGGY